MSLQTVKSQPKYGLIKRQPTTTGGVKAKRPQIFQVDDDDDDEDVGKSKDFKTINQEVFRKSIATTKGGFDKLAVDALAEDPNVFDYDGSYDEFKKDEKSRLANLCQQLSSQKEAPKARYIENLLVAAKIRERERDKVYERKLLKERLEEDKILGVDSEEATKFMTTAYKEKLLQDQKWQYEEKLMDEIEKRTNVENKGMHGFYTNLLTKNVSMGGNVAEHAVSSFTAGSVRQKQVVVPTHLQHQESLQPQQEEVDILKKQESDLEPRNKDDDAERTDRKQVPPHPDVLKNLRVNSSKAADTDKKEQCPVEMEMTSTSIHPNRQANKSKKDEAVDSAKARYLARKRSAAVAEIEE